MKRILAGARRCLAVLLAIAVALIALALFVIAVVCWAIALVFDVFGDGAGEWLRSLSKNAPQTERGKKPSMADLSPMACALWKPMRAIGDVGLTILGLVVVVAAAQRFLVWIIP